MGSNVHLASLREERSSIDASIAKLEHEIALLRQRRAELDKQIAAIPYPVLDIPDDIAIAIFESAIFSAFEDGDPILVRIAAVCGKWRNIAVGTPTLWQRFSAHDAMADMESLFCVFAQRSLDLPLYLHIRIGASWDIPPVLVRHGYRWKEATFASEAGFVRLPYKFDGTWDFRNLEALTAPQIDINPSSDKPDMNAFGNAPLQRLCIGHPSHLGYYAISPHRLQTLEFLGHIDELKTVQLLRDAVNLEHLTLGTAARYEAEVTEPILMTKLASLDTGAAIVFEWITAPGLHTLRLPSSSDFAQVTRCLDRSSCALRAVAFSSMPSLEGLQALLPVSAMESVSSLSINFDEEIEGDDSNRELISTMLGKSSLLPSLRSLEVSVSYPLAWQIWPFVRAVKQRAAFAEPHRRIEQFLLRFAYVDEMWEVDVQDLIQLQREHGLRVDIPTGIARWEKWGGK